MATGGEEIDHFERLSSGIKPALGVGKKQKWYHKTRCLRRWRKERSRPSHDQTGNRAQSEQESRLAKHREGEARGRSKHPHPRMNELMRVCPGTSLYLEVKGVRERQRKKKEDTENVSSDGITRRRRSQIQKNPGRLLSSREKRINRRKRPRKTVRGPNGRDDGSIT